MPEITKDTKRSLGRGLGSLLGDDLVEEFRSTGPITTSLGNGGIGASVADLKPGPEKETDTPSDDQSRIWQIDIEKISPNVYQPRRVFSPEKLQELSASIKEKGILQPVVVRKISQDHYEIIAGERRWRAAQAAGLDRIPVILKDVQNQESLELALIENLQRHDLNPIEEAEAFQRLSDEFNLNQSEIAQKVGKDRATVANSLRLLGLAKEVKEMLASGEITTGHAKALLVLTDHNKQRELAKKITSEKLTVRAAEKLVQSSSKKHASNDGPAGQDSVEGRLVRGLQDDLAKALGTKVEIHYHNGQGNIFIKFYTNEDLTRIVERIKG
ncbi:MAG: ParB/RepB/Spo0J family partition protein [Oligoflexia bacterium]|nr:ParB/RepB/Spo0J family partition protein [Oligoflexia bacterium]